jgi:hypothetical protein
MSHVASYRKSTWRVWLLMSLLALSTITAYKPVAAMNSPADAPVVLIADILRPVYTTSPTPVVLIADILRPVYTISSHDTPTAAFTHFMPPGDTLRSCLYMAWAFGLRPSKLQDAPAAAFMHVVPPGDTLRSCLYMAWAFGLRPSN